MVIGPRQQMLPRSICKEESKVTMPRQKDTVIYAGRPANTVNKVNELVTVFAGNRTIAS